jgi:hypothetical protein
VHLLVVASLLLSSCTCCGQPSIACQGPAPNEAVVSVLKLCATRGGEAWETTKTDSDVAARRSADDRVELLNRLSIPQRSSAPEPARLNNFTRMREPLVERNSNRGPFSDYDDYQKRALSAIPTDLISYGVRGHEQAQIVLTTDYYAKLLPELPGSATEKAQKVAESKTRVGPADIPPLLDSMPDSRYFKRIFILDAGNPEDDWVSQSYKFEGFISTMAMIEGELSLYQAESNEDLRRDILHEWSHALRYEYWHDSLMKSFNDAVNLELPEWSPSIYATRCNGEQWAVLGERMLGNSAESFLEACDKAPLRSALWMHALRKCLAQVPESMMSVDHDKYVQRQEYVDKHIVPRAVEKLKAIKIAGATKFLRAQADSILQYFAQVEKS